MKEDFEHMVDSFCEGWVLQLQHDDKVALGLFSSFQQSKHFSLDETKSAELAGAMIGRSDRTVREWRSYFTAMRVRYLIVSKENTSALGYLGVMKT